MQQHTRNIVLSILAFLFLAGLLSSSFITTYTWWTWSHGNRFCSTPLGWALLLEVAAIAFLACLVCVLSLLRKTKKRSVTPRITPRKLCSV